MSIDFKPEQNDYTNLTPFKTWLVAQINTWGVNNFPFLEGDFDKLTNYGMMMKLMKAVNNIINNQNLVEDDMSKLYTAFTELQTYVDNYLTDDNLQPLVNNKLDIMAQDGTLDELINQEVFGEFNRRLNLLDSKKYVFVGDSYLEGYNPDGNVTSWGTLVQNYLGLTSSQVITSYLGGSSFAGSKPFTNLITSLSADSTVTDVIICGGFNDRTFNRTQIKTGMKRFKNAVNTKFPNAKIKLGFIGWSSNPEYLYTLYNTFINYKWCANELGIEMFTGCEYSLHDYFLHFASDGIHPTLEGQQSIARNLVNCILNGSADVKYNYKNIGFSTSGSATEVTGGTSNFSSTINNSITNISSQGRIEFTISGVSYLATGLNDIEVGTITSGCVIGNNYKICSIPVQMIVHGDQTYYKENGILIFRNGKLYLSFTDVNNSGNNYLSITAIDKIQLFPFNSSLDTMFC